EVRTAMIGTRGEEIFKTWKPDVVITDMMLPDVDGLELLRKFKQTHADTEVIVVTGHGSVPKAVEAMKGGAHSFVEKPIEPDTLLAMLERAIERRDLVSEHLLLKQKGEGQFRFGNILGKSQQMHEVLELQEREYRPIGSDRIVRVDFRLVCATNIDLDAALRDGKLREDLYFRINTITLRVPPLRERTEDIPLLCEHFLEKYRQRHQRNVKSIAPAA